MRKHRKLEIEMSTCIFHGYRRGNELIYINAREITHPELGLIN